ncbi:MAG TPA: hypothetical protein VHD56_01100 [Tepidisphaeraceae bacterium]|nr:hypothetical protein [Tepidisphaeraceae bacterium]
MISPLKLGFRAIRTWSVLGVGAVLSLVVLASVPMLFVCAFAGLRLGIDRFWIQVFPSDGPQVLTSFRIELIHKYHGSNPDDFKFLKQWIKTWKPDVKDYEVQQSSNDWIVWSIRIYYMLLLGITLPLPILWWRRRRLRQYRIQNGLCENCGYDLRESSDRCPECGHPIEIHVDV